MIRSEVTFRGGTQLEATARGHWIMCDQPFEYGGTDEGMTPLEMLLSALASCAGSYASQYMKARSLPSAGLRVRASAEKRLDPPRLESFQIQVVVPELEERFLEGLRRAVEVCPVHRTLLAGHSVSVELTVNREALAPA